MINERQWYVVYTKSNAEKKFTQQVQRLQGGCEAYLPLTVETRKWSDRTKTITVPLFKSYVFVYVNGDEFQQLKRMVGFVNYVRFNNQPATVSNAHIHLIKQSLQSSYAVSSLASRLVLGVEVEIIAGSLQGYRGTLIERQNKQSVAIEVRGLEQSMLVTIPIELLKVIGAPQYG
ncbi:transcriptional activator RfaH [Pseudoalteromonas sp. MSK9-3]|uniref:UpxY family transcription antiterminator n=1 Tax=Pseudoalteromonas sp. MSK9-3 TaxID=1897633 RepID=UPI000E6CB0E4|nr:UpxY family transcription antiterminator [Pseudoalteromonas sp. MSK9-3]RJE76980.1 transcriptional activator RfaH [Pseudoalteromonas sp. MSK9-3]